MYTRTLENDLLYFSKKYPIITLLGPRQAGKTTLIRKIFHELPYINLEDFEQRSLAKADPKSFLEKFPEGAIFDEIQRVPELLSSIQVKVDQALKKGMFILTGSHQVQLHAEASQSLAGRTTILRLLPLSLEEIRCNDIEIALEEVMLKGGYPRIYHDNLPVTNAYSSYFQTYVERDVRSIINIKDILKFEKFVKLLAARVGQVINYASLATDVGISAVTIKEWVAVLEASYLIFKLDPYFENFGKRLIKSPKIYFTDTGLLCYLLGIETIVQLQQDMLYGNIFENFAILELHKACYHHAREPRFYFYRDVTGKEVDLLIQKGSSLIPIEIKSSKTFQASFLDGIFHFHQQAGARALKGALVYSGLDNHQIKNVQVLPIEKSLEVFKLEKDYE
ncbi:MAG: ATP-binding protein [Gammaproteobacteria bacterium]|nr:ATP-binding protein [Gammaproteobacteria bacterium]